MVKLGFYGAAGEVTGSCYVVETDRARVMVDFGMHQGEREADEHNRQMVPMNLEQLDAVVLTHAHLDHCGRLPMLIKRRYRGKIYCTPATADVTEIILRDSARLQAEDYERFLRRIRARETPREPLYSEKDVEQALPRLTHVSYDRLQQIADGISIKFVDAGHILGAASVQMLVQEGSRTVTIVFSGDVGQVGSPILRDPVTPLPGNAVLLESTYGDRDHRSLAETCDEFLSILRSAQETSSKVLIPAFAVGRTQDITFHIGEFIRDGRLGSMRTCIDSPMATSVSNLYSRYTDVYDERAKQLLAERMKPLGFPGLTYVQSTDESKALNDAVGPMVVIAGNGMCTGGRIMHHLRHNLPNPNVHVVMVGYQGQGTLGRRLVDRAKYVSIFGRDVAVRAKVHTLGGFSAHAGQSGLVDWAAPFQASQPRIFLTHGEDMPRKALRNQLRAHLQIEAEMPQYGHTAEL